MPSGEIRIQTVLHPNPIGRWISIPVSIAGAPDRLLVLDPGSPVSAISPETRDDLSRLHLLPPASDLRYEHRLADLVVQEQPLPDFDVRVLRKLSRLGVDGLIGLDFLRQFFAIHYYVGSMELVLEYPS